VTPFPILTDLVVTGPPHWPVPPSIWMGMAPVNDTALAQACSIESLNGARVDGEMLAFEPARDRLTFRTSANGPTVTLKLSHVRRLTLTTPWAGEAIAGMPSKPLPTAAHEREYRLQPRHGNSAIVGRTIGHVETEDGLYLFTPANDERSVVRQFVPRSSYLSCEYGLSALEAATARWISSPAELLQALERQRHMQVRPIGQSLLELGLLTERQLAHALATHQGELPLGESLVAAGTLSRYDLQIAIAFKMGYPYVDLSRFPIDADVATMLPAHVALQSRALPLMRDKLRLIVAVDDLTSVVQLSTRVAFARLQLVPVLATKSQILLALSRLPTQDVYAKAMADSGARP
jgi:hypothetical protein